jgi:hypothetical protein
MHPKNPIPSSVELTVIIPWVHIKTDDGYIKEEFNDLEWGDVLKVDFVHRSKVLLKNGKNNPEHYKVFIHFNNLTTEGKRIKNHLNSELGEIKVNHYHGHWIVRKSNWKFNTSNRDRSAGKPNVEYL